MLAVSLVSHSLRSFEENNIHLLRLRIVPPSTDGFTLYYLSIFVTLPVSSFEALNGVVGRVEDAWSDDHMCLGAGFNQDTFMLPGPIQ